MKIRKAKAADQGAINEIHISAFGQQEGPEIIELIHDLMLDETASPVLSLVAEKDGVLAGHILFTAARLEPEDRDIQIQILAPLAVANHVQGQGIGGQLINEGLKQLAQSGIDLVFVLGHPGYYPRFGFQTAGRLGFAAPHSIPPEHAEAWMVQELKSGKLLGNSGTIQCSNVLNQPRYWRE